MGPCKISLSAFPGPTPKWSEYLPDALLAYRNNPTVAGPTPYESLFGQRPRLLEPRATQSFRGKIEKRAQSPRLANQTASKEKEKYRSDQPKNPREFVPGDMVSVRVLSPKKAETPWRPGYEVLRCFQGALLLRAPEGHEVRMNQERVRLLPLSSPTSS